MLELFHDQFVRSDAARSPVGAEQLTQRQRDVLRCLLRGPAEKAVATELGISTQTVHSHVKAIYAAFGVSSRAELLVRCLGARARIA